MQLPTYTLSTLQRRQSSYLLVKRLISIFARRWFVGIELILINVDEIETLSSGVPNATCMPKH